jgi:hypothetical protein
MKRGKNVRNRINLMFVWYKRVKKNKRERSVFFFERIKTPFTKTFLKGLKGKII